jgi:hypothetical protein
LRWWLRQGFTIETDCLTVSVCPLLPVINIVVRKIQLQQFAKKEFQQQELPICS